LSIPAVSLLLPRHSALVRLNCDPPVGSSVMLRSSAIGPQHIGVFLPTLQVSESLDRIVLFTASSLIISVGFYLFIHLFVYSFIHIFIRLFIYLFFIYLFIHSFIDSFIHLLIRLFIYFYYVSIYVLITGWRHRPNPRRVGRRYLATR
jgi:hypothetical protein